jgi:hypothetical protein
MKSLRHTITRTNRGDLLWSACCSRRREKADSASTSAATKRGFLVSWWLVGCFSVLAALSQDAKAQLKTSVDATTVTIGDVVTVKLSVKHPETLKIAFPPVGTSLGEWTVRSSEPLAQRSSRTEALKTPWNYNLPHTRPAISRFRPQRRNCKDEWREGSSCFRAHQDSGPVGPYWQPGHAQRPQTAS